jgi:hypothetical protein
MPVVVSAPAESFVLGVHHLQDPTVAADQRLRGPVVVLVAVMLGIGLEAGQRLGPQVLGPEVGPIPSRRKA